MKKLVVAWGVTWRMVIYGIGLGLATGAIYGPVSMLILYAAELLNGRYTLSDFPYGNAITFSVIAVIVGAAFGGVLGLLGGMVSGITLTLGLLLSAGHLFSPGLYRNMIVVLGVAGSSVIVLLPMSTAILSTDWFFNGQGPIPPMIALAVLPASICAVSTWWAGMRVVKWWRTQGTRYKEHADAPGLAVEG